MSACSGAPAAIDAMIAAAERRQYLVADRAGLAGDRVDVVAGADQLGEASRACRLWIESSHVDCHEIHRDAPDDRNSLAGDGDAAAIAERPQPPIGVADGDGRDSAGPLPTMGRTVANGVARVNVAGLQDSTFETNDLRHGVGLARQRIDAVERGARAGDVEMIGRAE